jgi:hypothetical protein
MPRRRNSRRRRIRKALGIAGVSLSLAGGASEANAMPGAAPHRIYDEEVSDVTLATFYIFDSESIGLERSGTSGGAGTPPQNVCRGCARCRTCRACRGCTNAL